MRSFVPAIASVLTLVLLTACGDDPSSVEADLALVSGDYSSEGPYGSYLLTTTASGTTEEIDWLARGASITLSLGADGTTTGRLFVPGGDEDGGDLDEDLTGTWSVSGGVVRMDHDADTFLRDMPLQYDDGRLQGEETFGGDTVRLVMIRL